MADFYNQNEGAPLWNLEQSLHRISHWLPSQGPIKDFIHHNTLHALQHHPFHEALEVASQMYGARSYLSVSWYQAAYREGKITETALRRVSRKKGITSDDFAIWKQSLLGIYPEKPQPLGVVQVGLRSARDRVVGVELATLVHPLLFRLLSSYLDQGVSIWRMPHARDSFWGAVGKLVAESRLPMPPLSDRDCLGLLNGSCEQAIEVCLSRIVGDPALYEDYLLETCLAHPGWSGMVAVLENNTSALLSQRPIRLQEMIAVELLCELGWLIREAGEDFPKASQKLCPKQEKSAGDDETQIARAWHEAFEWSLYESALSLLENKGAAPLSSLELNRRTESPSIKNSPRFQAFFCIDDRECSFRRHLEAIEPGVETFGTAGFFGIDFLFQPASSAHAFQYCPVVLKPRHVVKEVSLQGKEPKVPSLRDWLHLSPSSNTLFRGWLLTQTLGILSLLKLAKQIFWPSSKLLAEKNLTRVEAKTQLQLLREEETVREDGLLQGYSYDEMADRVYGVLSSAGARANLAKLVIFVAHGASSANNPHFAAYDCGACSGKPGSPNARAFAWMANHPEVRNRLKQRGVALPNDSYVVGAIHDTTRDEMTYFDVELIPETHRNLFNEAKECFEAALARNAKERCQKFELAPRDLTEKAARKHVLNRALSIFEPRPELNHATNALCIVGRRELSRGLFFDRRAFLNSYDPLQDASGKILEGILGAVVPVCGGINLEYYFSRVDNLVYGAGSKLPHNVVSLLGVANGVEGDLLTGLPSQMIEVHDPIRLLIIVEQEPSLVLDVIQRRPAIFEWIKNDWVKLACFSPSEKRNYYYEADKMMPVEDLPMMDQNPFFQVAVSGGVE